MIIREYEQDHAYSMFLLHEMQGQAEIERYVNEATVLTEGGNIVGNMSIVNEGFIESIKERINKLAAFIKKMWAKFLEIMNRLVRTNNSYLVKYKDVILKNKFDSEDTADMYDWKVGKANILTNVVINYPNEQQLVADMETKDTFIAKYFPNIVSNYKQPYDFAEICKSYFRGGEDLKTYNASELDNFMKEMYDYCISYGDKIKNLLQKDYDSFMKQSGQLMDKFFTAEKNATNNPPATNTETNNNESSIWDEEKFYSCVYESFITEAIKVNDNRAATNSDREAAKPNAASAVKVNDRRGTNNNEPPKSTTATIGNKDKQQGQQGPNKIATDKSSLQNTNVSGNGETAEDIKKLGNAVSDYVDVMNTYLTTRMSAAEAMYKDFMKIIRYHVTQNVGQTNNTKATVGKMGSSDNTAQPQQTSNSNPFNNTQPQQEQPKK